MAKEEKKAPKLRFNGYTNDWERKKLGEIGSVSMNKRIFKDETSTIGEIPFYKIGTFGGKADAFITRKKYEEYKKKYPYPQKGNLLISASGSIGRIIEYNGEEAYYQDSNIVWLDHDNTILDVFLKPTYEIIKWDGIEGTTIKRLYNKNILNTVIYKPNIDEQRKIGKLFIILNNTVQLHERKCEELTLIKKALLQKFFPKKDEVTPEVRYKSFSDDWEQRKFGDLYKKVSEKNDGTYGADKVISVANMYYKSDVKISGKNYLKTYNIFKVGDIAFEGNKSKHFAHGRFVENTIGDGIVSHVFDVFRPTMSKYDLQYWSYLINNENVMGKILIKSTNASTMMTNLVSKDFLKQNIIVPNSYEEEKKIGKFLNEFDSLIALHQRKLEKLKQLKKFLLQNMFI